MKKQKKTNKQKNGVQENNIKYVYWPITRTLKAHLTSNWPQVFIKSHKGVEISGAGSFKAIALSTYRWRHPIHQKVPHNAKK